MPTAPAFSRLQLAAALLEYDNDPTNPNAPVTRAQDSAIFAHFRRNPAAPPQLASRKSDYLGVSLPSETGSLGGRESLLDNRRSRASRGSLDALRNPFGPDDRSDEEEGIGDEEELEVDLASWGLDNLIPEKGKSVKGKGKASTAPPHAVSSVPSHYPSTSHGPGTAPRRAINTSRSVSLGGIAEYSGASNHFLEAARIRRKSFGSPLDFAGMDAPQLTGQRFRRPSYSAAQPSSSAPQPIPFPSSSARSPSPRLAQETFDHRVSIGSRFEPRPSAIEGHKLSRASTDSKMMVQDEGPMESAIDNPFAIRPPSPSRFSRFDPKATVHTRTFSNVSGGSRMLLDQDDMPSTSQDIPRREHKFATTMDLLRPKVLVMPSPLQSVTPEPPPPAQAQVRDGFLLSTDGPPLPPGARSSRRISALDAANKPLIASNSFTPNPLMNLSLSQMTFRNTLHVGGQRDPYADIVAGLPLATREGEQVEFDSPGEEVNDNSLPAGAPAGIGPEHTRPSGKLFGKSLIDDLEMRKAQMRSKRRVFTGDQRPSMMSRAQTRSTTLIDPATLNNLPANQGQSSFGIPDSRQTLSRKTSLNAKPLLSFDDEGEKFKPTTTRIISSRSVFGVDTLWEQEMVKLREIQAQQAKEAEKQKIVTEQQEKKKRKKIKKHRKGQEEDDQPHGQLDAEISQVDVSEPKVSLEPPVLPDITRATRPPPRVTEEVDDDDVESNDEILLAANAAADDAGKWFSDSDEEGPRRITGVGPRYPSQNHRAQYDDSDEDVPLSVVITKAAQRETVPDSDEDLPLAAVIGKATRQTTRLQQAPDSDEERPLSYHLQKKAPIVPPTNLQSTTPENDDDDDEKPLGLRAPSVALRNGDDDEMPLAFHPQQQRRTQYQMIAQQQQQQQQLMMHAQFQNSMFFNASSMYGSGFFSPPVMPAIPMMMQPPVPVPSPPPPQDAAKFGRVDKWRHDVAVEGTH